MVVSGGFVSGMGGTASTVKERVAGEASWLRAGSIAFTAKIWAPSPNGDAVNGDEQEVNGTPSMLHWKVTGCSSASKVKVGVASAVVPVGPVTISVSGTTMSTRKETLSGVA